jgi:CBS domain-containing protein
MTELLARADSSFGALTVGDAMHHGIVTCGPEASLREVVGMLAEHAIHSVVVADFPGEDGVPQLWGFVSDVDVLRALCSPIELHAGNLAALEVVTATPDDRLERAARLMAEHELAHLIVVEDDRPVGVLSTLDIATALSRMNEGGS